MEVNVTITVSEDDIKRGFTAADVVRFAFPNSDYGQDYHATALNLKLNTPSDDAAEPGLDSTDELTDAEAEEIYNREVNSAVDAAGAEAFSDENQTAALDETVQDNVVSINNEQQEVVDSAGVPWNKEIHSSNKKFYMSGAEANRWMWKRGTDPVEREATALQLAASLKSVPAPLVDTAPNQAGVGDAGIPGSPAPAAVPGTVVGIPTPENNAPAAVPAVEIAAVPGNSGAAIPQSETPDPSTGISWPDFVKQVTAQAVSVDRLNEVLAHHDIDQMALLSPGDDNPSRNAVAATLGFI